MKIYQVHEHSGMYEDYTDIIIGTFIHPNNAENLKAECDKKEIAIRAQYEKCWDCEYNKDCFKPSDKIACVNEIMWHDNCIYTIEEVEVLDWSDKDED